MRAIEDATIAAGMLGNRPIVLGRSAVAHVAAALTYKRTGQMAKHDEHLARAKQNIAGLDPAGNPRLTIVPRGWYYEIVGDADAALVVWRGDGPRTGHQDVHRESVRAR